MSAETGSRPQASDFGTSGIRTVVAAAHALLAAFATLIALASYAPGTSAQAPLIADPDDFYRRVRENLKSDPLLQNDYTYVEKRRDLKTSWLGKVSTGPLKVYEVFPSLEDGLTYRRLISVDGVPVPREEIDKQDREHRSRVEAQARRAARGSQSPGSAAERRRRERSALDELFVVFDIRPLAREVRDGESTIVFSFAPRPGAKPRTAEGRMMKEFAGRAWVTEKSHQLLRLEAEAVDDVSFGLGLLGRLYKGSRATFLRGPVGAVWLPRETRFSGRGRALLRSFAVDTLIQYENYQPRAVNRPPGGSPREGFR